MRILVLDNYDSFTYNLVHLLEACGNVTITVTQNDAIDLSTIPTYDKIILSPGPGLPSEAGLMPELLQRYASTSTILGICLGWQAIGERFQSPLKNLSAVHHGIASKINLIAEDSLFQSCPSSFNVGRYHSWVIDENHVHSDLIITAVDEHHHIMAGRHKQFDVKGLQFHPESILSEYGKQIISNWLNGFTQ
jgi:anthranilate synthase component 2